MRVQKKRKHRKLKITLAVVGVVIAALVVFFFAYTSVYYRADDAAQTQIENAAVEIYETENYIACGNKEAQTGYIFYPGAKVDAPAYLPYLIDVAADGDILCFVVKPAFHLAILSPNAAGGVMDTYSDVEQWIVGGHSLGGVVAAGYTAGHSDIVRGLILLASYPNEDLSSLSTPVLSITATNDEVLNRESYEKARPDLPGNTEFFSIEGGNHGQFGSYGIQKGDGKALITPEEQREATVEATVDWIAAQVDK